MAPSWVQILIVVALAVLLFGRGKISDIMGDVAKGIKSFRKGMSDGDAEEESASASSSGGAAEPRIDSTRTGEEVRTPAGKDTAANG